MSECTPSLTPSLTQSLTRTLPLFFFVLGVLKTGGNEACKGCSCVSENIHTHMRRPLSFPQSSHESTVLCESRHHDSNKSQHSNTNMQANKQTISTLTEAKDKHHAVQERESARDVCARARVCVCVCVCVCAQRLISLTFSAPSSCTRCSCTHHSDTPPCSPHPAGTEGRTEGSRVEHVERGV